MRESSDSAREERAAKIAPTFACVMVEETGRALSGGGNNGSAGV